MVGRSFAFLLIVAGCGRIGFDGSGVPVDGADGDALAACGPGSEVEYVAPAPPATAKWVAPGGSDSASGASKLEAWATFLYAMSRIQPGDTLVLADGIYTESLRVTISGQVGLPIVIRAETDGGAIIDGTGTTVPCSIDHATLRVTDVIVEGIQFRNSLTDVIRISGADRVTMRRVSGYEAADSDSVLEVLDSNDVLVEDLAASGRGDMVVKVNTSNGVTIRRAWAHWTRSTSQYSSDFTLTDTNDAVIENSVGSMDPSATADAQGFQINATDASTTRANRNLLFGNVMRHPGAWGMVIASQRVRIDDNRLVDNVFVGGRGGIFQRADTNFQIERQTVVGQTEWTSTAVNPSVDPKDGDFILAVRMANSVVVDSPEGIRVNSSMWQGAITLESNNVFSVTEPYSGLAVAGATDTAIDPGFDTARFGTGAYLVGPTALGTGANGQPMGARVLYRAYAGVVSTERLWPWPMETRIRRETGTSVTWEEAGGVWKTLCGVY